MQSFWVPQTVINKFTKITHPFASPAFVPTRAKCFRRAAMFSLAMECTTRHDFVYDEARPLWLMISDDKLDAAYYVEQNV